MSYPDILRRGELESRGDEREEEEKEQRHISSRTISNSEKSFFFTADEMNFLGSRRLLLFPRAQWSPYYYN